MPPVPQVDLDTYVDDVSAPIHGPDGDGTAVGSSAAYDDDFLAVKSRIDGLGTLSGRIDQEKALSEDDSLYEEEAATDFAFIASTGHRILVETSKDLRIACYVALALYHTHGLKGMATGIAGLEALIDTYWDNLFPPAKRMRGRGAALNFLMQRLTDALDAAQPPEASDRAPLERTIETISELAPTLMDRMGEHAPVTSKLKRRLKALLKEAPAPEPETDPASETADTPATGDPEPTPAEPEASGGGADAGGAEPTRSEATASEAASETASASTASPSGASPSRASSASAPDTPRPDASHGDGAVPPSGATPTAAETDAAPDLATGASTQEAEQAIVRAAGILRDADPTDPRPYQLLRTMRWAAFRAAPQNDGGRTRIQPPRAQRLDFLRGLSDDAPDALVAQAEDAFQQPPFHFWLDLQRLLVQGMERSDADYAAARRVVLVETALLVDRVPDLLALTFADGTPFADDVTRAWVETTAEDVLAGGGDAAGRDAVDEARSEAKRRLGAEGLDAALDALAAVPSGRPSQRTQFRIRLATAQTCLQGGRPGMARPMLDALVDAGTRADLARWEPGLMAEVWEALYRCLCRLHSDADAPRADASDADASGAGDRDEATDERQALHRRAREAYERVCALDPSRALTLPTLDSAA